MIGRRFLACTILGGLLALSLGNRVETVRAQETSVFHIPFSVLAGKEPVNLIGLTDSVTFPLPLQGQWRVNGDATLILIVEVSKLLDPQTASLNVYLNEKTLVASIRIADLVEKPYQLNIHLSKFSSGENTITFAGRLYLLSDKDTNCSDWSDPSRWLSILPDSALSLPVEQTDFPPDLANFPAPFVTQSGMPPLKFVLPDQITDDDLSSFADVNYAFGRNGADASQWNPEIVSESKYEQTQSGDFNAVVISGSGRKFTPNTPNKDFIRELPVIPGKPQRILVLGDYTAGDGFNPAQALADPGRALLMSGDLVYLDDRPLVKIDPFVSKFSFQDLGYDHRTVRGFGLQSLIYRVYIPYDVQVASVEMDLRLTHSPILSSDRSEATLYLNGFAVAGIILSARSANPKPLVVSLPGDHFRPGYNFMRLTFDMRVLYSTCQNMQEELWATVHSSTTMSFSVVRGSPVPRLDVFPFPFSDVDSSLLVVPDQLYETLLIDLARLSVLMGAASYPGALAPRVVRASDFDPGTTNEKYIMLIGTPRQNATILKLNKYLPQPFTPDGSWLQNGYGISLPDPQRIPSIGVVEILSSPWVKNGRILVLSGTDPTGLNWAFDLMLDPSQKSSLKGNLVLVSSGARSQTQTVLETTSFEAPDISFIPLAGSFLQSLFGPGWGWPVVAILLAVLMTIAILFWGKYLLRIRFPNISRLFEKKEDAPK